MSAIFLRIFMPHAGLLQRSERTFAYFMRTTQTCRRGRDNVAR